jgi:hypothetical protein
MLPNLIINIAYLSLSIASPLTQWHHASQVMLKKGKGRFIENLRIIQLCEADLNMFFSATYLIKHYHRGC